jgi:coproporphyrinogen III oxidase
MNKSPEAMMEDRRQRAWVWFATLRDRLCNDFEALENKNADPVLSHLSPGRFEKKTWRRGTGATDEGGGETSLLRGRIFEKLGVHISKVYGTLPESFACEVAGGNVDRRFWAAGISVIAHPRNPHIPAAHMNTRYIMTDRAWFGGGADLTPMLAVYRRADHEDALTFHAALENACNSFDASWYDRFKTECDRYFFLPHRQEARGIGGIFFDHHDSGDWEKDFAFVQEIGRGFLNIYPKIVAAHAAMTYTEEERNQQLVQRGRYAEFNLLYDRGTRFGLQTGGNVEAILSSLPPLVGWP